jgi:hypothetical protein
VNVERIASDVIAHGVERRGARAAEILELRVLD